MPDSCVLLHLYSLSCQSKTILRSNGIKLSLFRLGALNRIFSKSLGRKDLALCPFTTVEAVADLVKAMPETLAPYGKGQAIKQD